MTPKLVDLICLPDGSWELCRVHPGEKAYRGDNQANLMRLPLEICADGTWVLSGLNKRKLSAAFATLENAIPDVMLRYVNALLHNLVEADVLHDGLWPKDANPLRIVGTSCLVLDEMRACIIDFIHALSESDRSLIERIEEASPISLAGLLREAGKSDLACRFLQDCPEPLLPLAEIPLITMDNNDGDDDLGFSFPNAIGNIEWTAESNLEHAVSGLHVRIDQGGTARINSTVWKIFGCHVLVHTPRCDMLQSEDVQVLQELGDVPNIADTLIRALSSARWKHLVAQGKTEKQRKRLVAPVSRIVHRQLDKHLQRLIPLVGQRIYPFDGISRPAAYARFFAGPVDQKIRARRAQARLATPLLVECVATGDFPYAVRAIDHGKPLIEALAKDIGVPHWVIGRLGKLPELGTRHDVFPAEFGQPDPKDLARVATVMASLGPDSPATRVETQASEFGIWINATRIDRLMNSSHDNFGRDYFGHPLEDTRLMSRAIGRKPALASIRHSHAPDKGIGRITSNMTNDTTRICLYYCIARESIRHHLQYDLDDRADVENTLAAWLLRQSPSELLVGANKGAILMQMHCKDIMSPMLRTALSERTRSLLEAHICDETGIEVIPLPGKAALEEEGRLMNHCVGGYWGRVANHQVEVFSLQSSIHRNRATLCLAKDTDDCWQIEEFKHAHNRKVTDERLLRAAKALCLRLDVASHALGSAAAHDVSFVRYDRYRFALQLQPAVVHKPLLACFPGTGCLETRIERAIAMAWRIRHRNRRNP